MLPSEREKQTVLKKKFENVLWCKLHVVKVSRENLSRYLKVSRRFINQGNLKAFKKLLNIY